MHSSADDAKVAQIRGISWRAHEVEMNTHRTLMESVDLMRTGKTEIEANPDGIDLGGPLLESLSALGMLSRAQLADPNSDAFQQGWTSISKFTRQLLRSCG